MKTIYSIFAFAGLSMAHNVMTHFHVNGVANPDCVRQAVSTNPLTVLDSDDMACNAVKGNGASKCSIKPGDTIAFEWRADPNIPAAQYPLKDGTIPVGVTDDSHKGPCAVYMKKVSDSSNAVGAGDGWFKVSEDGLLNGVFCTDRLRLANLPQPGVLPSDIAPGDYLLRAEFLTLNNAGPSPNPPVFDSNGVPEGGQPQFYVGCVQVTVEGTSGTANPSTVSIPGYVNINSPGLLYDIWNTPSNIFSNYPMPGPTPLLADGTAGTIAGSPDTVPSAVPSATSTAAGTPAGTPASSAKPTTKASNPTTVAAVSPTDDGSDSTPTFTPTTSTYTRVAPTDGGSDNTPISTPTTSTYTRVRPSNTPDDTPTVAPTTTPTHYSNIKYVTATTLITRTSTLRSLSRFGSDDSDAAPTGNVPYSTYHHGYHGARGHGSHRRRAL